VIGPVIMDFEASAMVYKGIRHFMNPKDFGLAAALLYAEGGVVSVDAIIRMCGCNSPKYVRSIACRYIKRLRKTEFIIAAGVIESVPGGYRFLTTSKNGQVQAASSA